MTMDTRMDPSLQDAYETCRRMHRRYDPTYYWATRRLPREVRPATHALYGYVRTADEIVDDPRRLGDPEARRAALDAWAAELRPGTAQPVARALLDAAERHALDLSELALYMGSMRVDCGPVRMADADALDAYMDGSAGSVGRIMAVLLGVPERHRADFGRLGQAFQLTNFLRDVPEDWALDRVYLPGVDPAELGAPAASRELRATVAREVRRARALFASAEDATESAPARVRPGIRLAVAAYRRVLDRIEMNGHDVLAGRSRLAAGDWPRVAAAVVRAA
jgi:phytoene synthase